ncbi:5-oxoprolinase subunit PxpB [Rehaibacterium terrae]|uniref:KipI family sensor histidine kinase inhibitor n=1 Tax=Rehaibacterium terrae TaxID=1341696 RepID=A0A7W7Y0D6_9GAMM|nr:KipI family sensor histidine kinase inhibitor [Rehaibacterium terrae]
MTTPAIEPLGDAALLLRWGERIDPDLNRRVHVLAAALDVIRPPWLLDLVPAYATLALYLDTAAFGPAEPPLAAAERWLRARLATLADHTDDPAATPSARSIEIPVRYGGEDGPDLDAVARDSGLSPDEVVARHTAGDYHVALLGFAPGFPYLLGLDPMLALPRLATPRQRVPAGSVAIGGAQTGIYPRESPGGWRIIGRTPLVLFDPLRDPPALLAPGDRVRFVAVDDAAFATHARERR